MCAGCNVGLERTILISGLGKSRRDMYSVYSIGKELLHSVQKEASLRKNLFCPWLLLVGIVFRKS